MCVVFYLQQIACTPCLQALFRNTLQLRYSGVIAYQAPSPGAILSWQRRDGVSRTTTLGTIPTSVCAKIHVLR
jgi:hypothetical protein